MKKISIYIIRAAIFILLPVFFYFRPFMPQPLQNMFLVFVVAVAFAEVGQHLFTKKKKIVSLFPLFAAIVAIFPYRADLEYFDSTHQVLIILALLLGVVYALLPWISTRKSSH